MKAIVYYTENGRGKRKQYPLVQMIQHDEENGILFLTYVDIHKGVDTTDVLPDTTEKIMLSYDD